MMIERIVAAAVLAVCAVLLARLLLNERRRYRFDMAMRHVWARLRRAAVTLWRAPGAIKQRRAAERHAEEAANDAIRRASGRGEWDGNVYRPKSFRKPPRDKMH
jgi:hypothetical protein